MAIRLVIMSQDVPDHCRVIDYFYGTKFMEVKTHRFRHIRQSHLEDHYIQTTKLLFYKCSFRGFRFYLHSFIFVRAICCCPTIGNICAWTNLTLTYIDYLNEDPSLPPPPLLSLLIHSKHSQDRNYFRRTEIILTFRNGLSHEINSNDQW